MRRVLNKRFFARNSQIVAKELLGKFVVHVVGGKEVSHMITETEAYDGIQDLASHASKGRTKRTEVLFGEAGTMYVYLCYGIHWMLNIVTDKKEYPSGVLIRGVEGLSGPGKVTKSLSVNGKFHGLKLGKENGIWIEDRGFVVEEKDIKTTSRVGVDYAGPLWSKKLFRFILKPKLL